METLHAMQRRTEEQVRELTRRTEEQAVEIDTLRQQTTYINAFWKGAVARKLLVLETAASLGVSPQVYKVTLGLLDPNATFIASMLLFWFPGLCTLLGVPDTVKATLYVMLLFFTSYILTQVFFLATSVKTDVNVFYASILKVISREKDNFQTISADLLRQGTIRYETSTVTEKFQVAETLLMRAVNAVKEWTTGAPPPTLLTVDAPNATVVMGNITALITRATIYEMEASGTQVGAPGNSLFTAISAMSYIIGELTAHPTTSLIKLSKDILKGDLTSLDASIAMITDARLTFIDGIEAEFIPLFEGPQLTSVQLIFNQYRNTTQQSSNDLSTRVQILKNTLTTRRQVFGRDVRIPLVSGYDVVDIKSIFPTVASEVALFEETSLVVNTSITMISFVVLIMLLVVLLKRQMRRRLPPGFSTT